MSQQVSIAKRADPDKGGLFEYFDEVLQRIRDRAHELFQSRGAGENHDWSDWFTAQQELFRVPPGELTESEADYTVRLALPGFSAAQLQVAVDERMLTVHGTSESTQDRTPNDQTMYSEFDHREVFRQFELPVPVSVDEVRAYLQHGMLAIHLPKQAPAAVNAPAAEAVSVPVTESASEAPAKAKAASAG